MERTFIVIEQSVICNADNGYRVEIDYGWDGERFETFKRAQHHGFKSRGSDDFNICILEGNTLVDYLWMNKCMDDPEGMRLIAEQNGFDLAPKVEA